MRGLYKKFGFLPYQIDYLEDKSPIKLVEKSRRIGMTYAQAFEDVMDCGVYGKFDVWFTSNNDLNGREYIRYCRDFAKMLHAIVVDLTGEEVVEDEKVYSIHFKNGKRITALSSSPEQLHGKGGKVILDEFGRREDDLEVWEATVPAARVAGHPLCIISTHNGKGTLFYKLVQDVKNGRTDKYSLHSTNFEQAVHQGLAAKLQQRRLTTAEEQEYIDNIRDSVRNPQIWAQQFMCEPQDDNEAFMPYALIEANLKAELLTLEQLKECRNLYAGLDIARKNNLTVLWIVERISAEIYITRHIRTMQNMDFPKQLAVIKQFLDLRNIRRLSLDYTGMGVGIGDELTARYGEGMIECVTFTQQTKQNLGFGLRNKMQDGGFLIPNDEVMISDFHSVKRETTATGNIRLSADTNEDTGSHADYFWAAALACQSASTGGYTLINAKSIVAATAEMLAGAKRALKGFSKDFN